MITDQQIAALRAFLVGEFDEYRRISGEFDDSASGWEGYGVLLGAAFFEAANDAFDKPEAAEVIRWVADLRAEFSDADMDFEPSAAERLIRAALGDGDVDDLDSGTVVTTQTILLPALATRADNGGTTVDHLLVKARTLADSWTE